MHLSVDARLYSPSFGIGRYTYEIIAQIIKLRPLWEITIFLNPSEYKDFISPNPNIHAIEAPEKIYSFSEQTSFLKKLNSVDADLTWFPHFNVPYFYKKPYIVTIHDLTISKFPGNKNNSWLHRFVYFRTLRNAIKKSKHILTVSDYTKTDLLKDEKVDEKKITVGYNAVGKEFREYQLPSDYKQRLELLNITSPFFLYTGVHRDHKNILGMVKGFHLFLKNNQDTAYQLVITGGRDSRYNEFWEYAKEYNLDDKIICAGKVSETDLHLLYKVASLYIFPSFYEGFGIPPLEAMACGTPVIVSHASCIPEVCSDAVEYFDPYSPKELSEKIELVLGSKQRRNELVAKGLKRIDDFSWEETAKKVIEVFENNM